MCLALLTVCTSLTTLPTPSLTQHKLSTPSCSSQSVIFLHLTVNSRSAQLLPFQNAPCIHIHHSPFSDCPYLLLQHTGSHEVVDGSKSLSQFHNCCSLKITNETVFNVHLRPEEGQSTLTETSARQTCLSHAGIREPNLSQYLMLYTVTMDAMFCKPKTHIRTRFPWL